jgi:hypothetical protein
MRHPWAVFCAAFLAFAPIAASAATITQLLANPSTFDGQHVDVTGKIEDLKSKVSHKGNAYVTFSLCSGRCVHVFAFGSPNISDGQSITVHGTFAAVKHTGSYTFYNEIDADDGSL